MSKIVVIGSSNTDMVIEVNRIPLPGETILGSNFFMNPGGKGANQAVAASRLGSEVIFISKVGNDSFGKRTLQSFIDEGINTDFIAVNETEPSGIALISISQNGENSIVVAPGANNTLEKKDIDAARHHIKEAAIILVQLEIPIEAVVYVTKLAQLYGKKVILNPAPAQELPIELYRLLYAITPNETEAEILTGVRVTDTKTAKTAAKILRNRGVPVVIITMGRNGAYVLTDTSDTMVAVPDVVIAKDTTAAGDTFNGALAVAIAIGSEIEEAIIFANKAASITVTKVGAQSAIPFLKDVQSSKNDFIKH